MAATTNATNPRVSWSDYYSRNMRNGGSVEAMFVTNMRELSFKSASHLDDVDTLTQTIAGSAYGNMVIVPGETGQMHVLHHGFALLAFVNGNTETATFASFSRMQAVEPILADVGRCQYGNSLTCPSLQRMFGVRSAAEFKTLTAEGNHILSNYPNHHLITPEVFLNASKGAKGIKAQRAFHRRNWRLLLSSNFESQKMTGLKVSWPCSGHRE